PRSCPRSLPDALPIFHGLRGVRTIASSTKSGRQKLRNGPDIKHEIEVRRMAKKPVNRRGWWGILLHASWPTLIGAGLTAVIFLIDRKSTRLNSSHVSI